MKITAHVPTQQYGFIEIECTEKELPEMERLYNVYAEVKLPFQKGVFKEIDTFTGEKVLYNDEAHMYTDLSGNKLVSGSEYSRMRQKPFDKAMILPKVSKKHGIPEATIDAMWTANSKISTTFGTSLHLAMEQWFRHKDCGTEKEYHLPKHPFLREAVLSFPLKDEKVYPEIMVSDIEKKMVGQIDGLVDKDTEAIIIDYKSDADISKNIEHHGLQLNFYRTILERKGWKIAGMQIWNYTDKWEMYEVKQVTIE